MIAESAAAIGRLVVVEDRATARRIVKSHRQTFGSVLPARSRRVRQWLVQPDGGLAGLWFLSSTNGSRGSRTTGGIRRVRRPKPMAV